MLSTELRDRTLMLLKNRRAGVTLQDISETTGLTRRWLENFVGGIHDDPGVSKVETLYVFLTGKKLELEPKELNL